MVELLVNRWYLVFAAFLVGGLIGILASFVWPSPYRASRDIYAAFDPYRMTNDHYVEDLAARQFRSGDDYKNWQMSQLSAYAVGDDILASILAELNTADGVSVSDLRSSMTVSFRNAGDWHLVFEHHDKDLAENVVAIWEGVLVEKVNQAVEVATEMRQIDDQLHFLVEEQSELSLRLAELRDIQAELLLIAESVDGLSSETVVSDITQAQIDIRVGTIAGWDPAWMEILAAKPAFGATAGDEIAWLDDVLAIIVYEIETIPDSLQTVNDEIQDLQTVYEELLPQTHGFSANLTVERYQETEMVRAVRVRSPGTGALVGGGIGLLALIGYQLWRASEE